MEPADFSFRYFEDQSWIGMMRQNLHVSFEEMKKKFRQSKYQDTNAINKAVNTRLKEIFPVNSDTTCAVEYLQSIKFKCFTQSKYESFDESVVPSFPEHIRCQLVEPYLGPDYMIDNILEKLRKKQEEGTLTKNQRKRLHRIENDEYKIGFTKLWDVKIYYEDGLLTRINASVSFEGP